MLLSSSVLMRISDMGAASQRGPCHEIVINENRPAMSTSADLPRAFLHAPRSVDTKQSYGALFISSAFQTTAV